MAISFEEEYSAFIIRPEATDKDQKLVLDPMLKTIERVEQGDLVFID